MKELKFSRNSWHAWIYQSAYNKFYYNLPTTICSYWWKLLFAIILFIPSWPGHLLNWIDQKYDRYTDTKANLWAFHVLLSLFFALIPAHYYWHDKFPKWYNMWGWYVIGFILSIIAVVICILVAIGLETLVDKLESKQSVSTKPSPIIEGFKAFKNKYCSKINWH